MDREKFKQACEIDRRIAAEQYTLDGMKLFKSEYQDIPTDNMVYANINLPFLDKGVCINPCFVIEILDNLISLQTNFINGLEKDFEDI